MAIVGRLLEAQGFRVGIIAQPDWHRPRLRGSSGDRTCSSASPAATWIRWSTATPRTDGSAATMRIPRAAWRQAPRSLRHRLLPALRQGYPDVPIVIGGIEAPAPHRALRLLVGEGPPLDPARRAGRPPAVRQRRAALCRDRASSRGGQAASRRSPTCAARRSCAALPEAGSRSTPLHRYAGPAESAGRSLRDETGAAGPRAALDAAAARNTSRDARAGAFRVRPGGRAPRGRRARSPHGGRAPDKPEAGRRRRLPTKPRCSSPPACRSVDREHSVIRLPSFEQVPTTRFSMRTPRGSCTWSRTPATRAPWCSAMARRDLWINPPPIPLETNEMDAIYELPYPACRIPPTATRRFPHTR